MNLFQRILVTALAFVVGVALAPLTPFLLAYIFWTDGDEDEP